MLHLYVLYLYPYLLFRYLDISHGYEISWTTAKFPALKTDVHGDLKNTIPEWRIGQVAYFDTIM